MFGLPTWAWQVIGYAVIILTILGCGMKLMSIWDAGKIAGYQKTIATGKAQVAQIAAVTKTITVADQAKEATAQTVIVQRTNTITKEIPVYVSTSPSPPVGCITWGMLRLHDAAILGVDPGSLGDPTTQPSSACSTVAPSVFLDTITENYGAANQNSEQLNALIADLQARTAAIAAAAGQSSPPPLVSLPHL
jgi:hypothetical protein